MVKPLHINKGLLTCGPAPVVPPSPVTNRQTARYAVQARYAWADCSSKLDRIREIDAGQDKPSRFGPGF